MERLAASITLSSGWKRALLALFAGALSVLALPPFGLFFVDFISFPILMWLLDGASGNPDRNFLARLMPAFSIGWLFGLGYFVAGLWWTSNALLVEANEFAWALPFAILGLPAYLALFYGLATLLARLFWSDGFSRLAALAAAFGLAEWLRSFVLTGFPWNSIGYAMMPFPLMMQSVAVAGTYAVNTTAVFVFAAPGLLPSGRGARIGMTFASLLFAVHLGYGAYALYVKPMPVVANPRIVRVVQPAIDEAAKIDDNERTRIFDTLLALTKAPPENGGKRPDYIVWPETAIPFILTQNPDALVRIADTLADGQILITGAVRTEPQGPGLPPLYYNSVYIIDSQGQIIGAADKVHLVPFGEYLPFESLWSYTGLTAIAAEMPGGFSAAPHHQMLTAPDGTKLYPLICYEAIFPYETGPQAAEADAIVNVTNDGWFGATPGPWQHFHQARIRAVESGLPVIRNANSGISAMVNSRGVVEKGLKFQVNGFFDTPMPAKEVPILNASAKDVNFGLLQSLLFLIVIFTRIGFIFNRN